MKGRGPNEAELKGALAHGVVEQLVNGDAQVGEEAGVVVVLRQGEGIFAETLDVLRVTGAAVFTLAAAISAIRGGEGCGAQQAKGDG